jgi:hypothetical protein
VIKFRESTANFKCDARRAAKPERMCAGWSKIYYSTPYEWATIIYCHHDGLSVADVYYANFCSERESSVCSG